MKFDIATPYTAVYVIFRDKGKVAFVLRENTGWMDGHYGLPAGRVEKNENFLTAARREASEEVGVEILEKDLKHLLTIHRNEPDSLWVDVIFEALDWQGDLYNAEPHVHSEVAWLHPEKLPQNVVPAVSFFLEQIKAGNTYSEYGW